MLFWAQTIKSIFPLTFWKQLQVFFKYMTSSTNAAKILDQHRLYKKKYYYDVKGDDDSDWCADGDDYNDNQSYFHLQSNTKEGVAKVIQILESYDLTREDWDSIMEAGQFEGRRDPVSKIPSKV